MEESQEFKFTGTIEPKEPAYQPRSVIGRITKVVWVKYTLFLIAWALSIALGVDIAHLLFEVDSNGFVVTTYATYVMGFFVGRLAWVVKY